MAEICPDVEKTHVMVSDKNHLKDYTENNTFCILKNEKKT